MNRISKKLRTSQRPISSGCKLYYKKYRQVFASCGIYINSIRHISSDEITEKLKIKLSTIYTDINNVNQQVECFNNLDKLVNGPFAITRKVIFNDNKYYIITE